MLLLLVLSTYHCILLCVSNVLFISMLGWSEHLRCAESFTINPILISLQRRTHATIQKLNHQSCGRLSHGSSRTIESLLNANNNNDETNKFEAVTKSTATIGGLTPSFGTDSAGSTTMKGITIKIALDMNGGVACRSEIRPERFTCNESLDMVHRLRAQSDAILIGVGTAITDDPSLLVRRPNVIVTKQPLRVVIDPTLRFISSSSSSAHQLLTDGYPVAIYHCRNDTLIDAPLRIIIDRLPLSVRLHYLKPDENDSAHINNVQQIVHHLQECYNVQHLMVEGGPKTALLFLQSKLIDRCILVHAPIKFIDPILSNITASVLESVDLIKLGSIPSGNDMIECWSLPHLPWPTSNLQDWP